MGKIFVWIQVFVFIFGAAGCKKKQVQMQEQSNIPSAANNNIPARLRIWFRILYLLWTRYGSVTQCPVMGEKVIVAKNTKAVKYKDKVYYLCCPACISEFKNTPEKYAK